MYYTLTPNCYKVSFMYHPLLVKCIRRIPSANYRADGHFWEVDPKDEWYLKAMAEWAVRRHLVGSVCWNKDEEPVESYEVPPMPELTVPHNMTLEPYEYVVICLEICTFAR